MTVDDPTAAADRQPLASRVIERFEEVGDFNRVLTQGEGAVYRLPAALMERLVVLDQGAYQALVLVAADGEGDQAMQAQRRGIRAALLGANYKVTERHAARAVIVDCCKNGRARTHHTAKGGPMAQFESYIDIAEKQGASDVHIQMRGNLATVRVRVDNVLEPLMDGRDGRYTRQEAEDAVAAGFNSSRVGTSGPQYDQNEFVDCMIPFDTTEATGQLRFQNLTGRLGPKVVVRLLRTDLSGQASLAPRSRRGIAWRGDSAAKEEAAAAATRSRIALAALTEAGYAPSHLRLWRAAARGGKGLVLVSGTVNSGKSTSLRHFIESLPDLHTKAIYTVESPIEGLMANTHQIEVPLVLTSDDETEDRFRKVGRALLRADLDGCMVAEIRDSITAGFAMQLVETGHLALGTTHAHLISTIVTRLTNEKIGLTRSSLTNPNIINLLVYQKLLPVLCTACADTAAVAEEADREVGEVLEVLATRFKVPTGQLRFKNPGGCAKCFGRGTVGRTIVAEMWQPDSQWLDHVRAGDDHLAHRHFRAQGDGRFESADMTGKTVFEHAMWKALQGQIDVRECEAFGSFERFDFVQRGPLREAA